MQTRGYLKYLGLDTFLSKERTKEILQNNPTVMPTREEAVEIRVSVFDYDAQNLEEKEFKEVEDCFSYKNTNRITWINIDGLRKKDVVIVNLSGRGDKDMATIMKYMKSDFESQF